MASNKSLRKKQRRKKQDHMAGSPDLAAHSDFTPRPVRADRTPLTAKTLNQKALISSIQSRDQTFVFGPAGTGKTYVPMRLAADFLIQKVISKIVLTRPNVASGNSLGFFPGELDEKMAPWVQPLLEVLNAALGASHVEYLLKKKVIEVVPFEVMRGRTFNDAFVLLDEAQNTTPHEIKMFLTRIGTNTKVVINGDVAQSDLGEGHNSGLSKALQLVASYKGLDDRVGVVEFDMDDIVRSDITGLWVRAFWQDENSPAPDRYSKHAFPNGYKGHPLQG